MTRSARPILLVWALLAAISVSLLLRAWLAPPRGTAFVGTFYYVDDFYNYLSFVEQAQRGELVFRSKLASPRLPPALVNVEWLAVGWLAALLGGRTLVAFRLFGLVALAALVALADRWLVRCGLALERRTGALLLVLTGGGLGGVLYVLGWLPGERAFDLRTGAFPFVEALANPHFVAGTTLLAASLAAFAARRPALGAVCGFLLGLVRPYDAALLIAVEGTSVLLEAPVRTWLRRLLPLTAIVPPLAYSAFVVGKRPGFQLFSSPLYAALAPSPLELLVALGPPAALAVLALAVAPQPAPARLRAVLAWLRDAGDARRAHSLRLLLWLALALLIVLLRPVAFSLQFLVGIGFPLLILAALALARLRHGALELAVPLLSSTAVVVALLTATPRPDTHVPLERRRLVEALGRTCMPGDLVLSPPDIGLYLGGLTPCWPYVSHPAAPDYPARLELVRRFYDPARAPAERALLLDRACVSHVVLPSGLPPGWLGGAQAFRPKLLVKGSSHGLGVWSRSEPRSCAPAP